MPQQTAVSKVSILPDCYALSATASPFRLFVMYHVSFPRPASLPTATPAVGVLTVWHIGSNPNVYLDKGICKIICLQALVKVSHPVRYRIVCLISFHVKRERARVAKAA